MIISIEWANNNSGFIMAVLTIVSVATTFIMAGLSWRANHISLKNLNQALQIEKERTRPYLVFDIEHTRRVVYANLKNLGQTGAFNISIKTNPTLETNFGQSKRESGLTSKMISFLAPQRTVSDMLGTEHEFYNRDFEPKFEGYIEYQDINGVKYKEPFLLDLNYVKDLVYAIEPDIGREMQKLVKEVAKISKSAERLRRAAEAKSTSEENA